jgi:mono/diheme cytochrome c family protein
MHRRKTQPAIWISAALLAIGAGALPGCRGDREDKPPHQFLPDMDDSPKFKPQTETPFYADGRAMRQPVEGTVAYGGQDFDIDHADAAWAAPYKAERADLIKDDDAFYKGFTGVSADGKPQYVKKIPVEVNDALLARGQERYNIYCVVCHGYQGNGQGTVAQKWTGLSVANFHDPKYVDPKEPDQKGTDGFLFYTARNGVPNPADPTGMSPKMPGYAHALTERDTWAIVAYVRALQESVPLADVPGPQRAKLQDEISKLPPEAPPGATGATGATGGTGGASGATGATQKGTK